MTKETILTHLHSVIYPNLNKSIVELKIIENIRIDKNTVTLMLEIANDEAYKILEIAIKEALKPLHAKVKIERKGGAKKNITFGTFENPNNRARYAKRIVAVTSGKGGVGKSTVCANLAVGFAQKGFKVGILDADVYGPNIPRLLGVMDEKLTWNDADKMVPSENFGVKVMSVGMTTPKADTPLVWRSSVAVSALIQFLEDVAWGELDILFIDMPPGTGDVQLTMAQEVKLDGGVIVATPQELALDDAARALVMFHDIKIPILGVVENMSFFKAPDTGIEYDIFGTGGAERLANRYAVPFLGKIPLEIGIRQTSDGGYPAVVKEDSKNYYREIVEKLIKALNLGI